MAIFLHEIPESRELTMDPPTFTSHWVLEGSFDDVQVALLVKADTPATYDHPLGSVLRRQDAQIHEVGFKVWNITIPYARNSKEIGSYRIEFDTLGDTVRVKGGTHINVYPSGKPTFDGLIGVKGDDVEGVDIVIPAMRIIVHYKHAGDYLTDDVVKTLSRLTGAVDNAGFFSWAPYETLFLGAQGSQTTDVSSEGEETTTEVSYHFAMSENLSGFAVGGITVGEKKGWDVAWVSWKPQVESGKPSQEVDCINIVRVYKERGLASILGFG